MMELSSTAVWTLLKVFLLLNVMGFIFLFMVKKAARAGYRRRLGMKKSLVKIIRDGAISEIEQAVKDDPSLFWSEFKSFQDTFTLPAQTMENVQKVLSRTKVLRKLKRQLQSIFMHKRLKAVSSMRILPESESEPLMLLRLQRERVTVIKLLIIYNLADMESESAIPVILKSLKKGSEYYRKKVLSQMVRFGSILSEWGERNLESENVMEQRLLLVAARIEQSEKLKEKLLSYLPSDADENLSILQRESLAVLEEEYTGRSFPSDFTEHSHPEVRKAAYRQMAYNHELDDVRVFEKGFFTEELRSTVARSVSHWLERNPQQIFSVLDRVRNAAAKEVREGYAISLENRLEYLFYRVPEKYLDQLHALIYELASQQRSAAIIDYCNTHPERFPQLREGIRKAAEDFPYFGAAFHRYARQDLVRDIPSEKQEEESSAPRIPLRKRDRALLFLLALSSLLIFPAASFIYRNLILGYEGGAVLFRFLIRDFHYLFAYYTFLVSSIYLILLFLSGRELLRQSALWSVYDEAFLFSPGLLPSISIIAPAYNEEMTIVESVYSLLSLKYPEYQVVVINDGSSDATLARLLSEFDLERRDSAEQMALDSAPVLGVYGSLRIPNLIVIDKVNGGKADALNAGINFAENEYVCSIDADSLLEPEALLKAMYQGLFTEGGPVAVGGNIVPVNGCSVDRGHLTEIHIPEEAIPRFQTIEYLRSFVSARIGWTSINGLLIISGAFGIFKKSLVEDVGGYLTGKGKLRRDTVGEDMELVVRLVRHLKENGDPRGVQYAYNANCWTEVPNNFTSLYRQRDRWHRGLIEVITYHKAMFMNPKYGAAGLLAVPYFVLFELIGPFLEISGYAVLFISLLIGAISTKVALLLFTVIVLFGLLLSLLAILFSERQIVYFRGGDFLKLMFSAFIENLGYRQTISMIRSFAYISFLFKAKGWQKFSRTGFATKGEKSVSGTAK